MKEIGEWLRGIVRDNVQVVAATDHRVDAQQVAWKTRQARDFQRAAASVTRVRQLYATPRAIGVSRLRRKLPTV